MAIVAADGVANASPLIGVSRLAACNLCAKIGIFDPEPSLAAIGGANGFRGVPCGIAMALLCCGRVKTGFNCGVLHTFGSKLYTDVSSSVSGGVCKAAIGLLAELCPRIGPAVIALARQAELVEHCDGCEFADFELTIDIPWLAVSADVGRTASVFGSGSERTGVSLSATFSRGL